MRFYGKLQFFFCLPVVGVAVIFLYFLAWKLLVKDKEAQRNAYDTAMKNTQTLLFILYPTVPSR